MLVNMDVCVRGGAGVRPSVRPALVVVGLIIRPQTEPEANRCLEEAALDQSQ